MHHAPRTMHRAPRMRVHTQGLHREALSQLVHARRDLPAARSYCRAYARSPREWQQHVLTLLDVLWAPAARAAEQGGAAHGGAEHATGARAADEAPWRAACDAFALRLGLGSGSGLSLGLGLGLGLP